MSAIDVDHSNDIEFFEFRMCNIDLDPDLLINKLNEIRSNLKKNKNGSY